MLKPVNYVFIFRNTHKRFFSLVRGGASIKETFAVDPFLAVPEHLLAPLPPGETARKNLVVCVENGSIDVDVHLIGEPPHAQPSSGAVACTELRLELCGGPENTYPLIAKIVRLFPWFISFH
jgi:hypothetical protein